MSNNIRLFSVFHKEYPIPNCDWITPIQVGRRHASIKLPMVHDDMGSVSISDKNARFCELTALYWIWQNLNNFDEKYIGLAHYRRYFFFPPEPPVHAHYTSTEFLDGVITEPKLWDHITEQLSNDKLIIPIPVSFSHADLNIKTQYIFAHNESDWLVLENTIAEMYPEYQPAFNRFSQTDELSGYNMFIGPKDFIQQYCMWLFPLLFAMEPHIAHKEDAYQNRVFGFMAERLQNVYILHHQIPTWKLPVLQFP
mgnify:CR=1 FL=1